MPTLLVMNLIAELYVGTGVLMIGEHNEWMFRPLQPMPPLFVDKLDS